MSLKPVKLKRAVSLENDISTAVEMLEKRWPKVKFILLADNSDACMMSASSSFDCHHQVVRLLQTAHVNASEEYGSVCPDVPADDAGLDN